VPAQAGRITRGSGDLIRKGARALRLVERQEAGQTEPWPVNLDENPAGTAKTNRPRDPCDNSAGEGLACLKNHRLVPNHPNDSLNPVPAGQWAAKVGATRGWQFTRRPTHDAEQRPSSVCDVGTRRADTETVAEASFPSRKDAPFNRCRSTHKPGLNRNADSLQKGCIGRLESTP